MRNLKKVLALVIAFSMMLSVVAFAGYNDVDAKADYAGAVELLSALDIIKGDENGNFNPDNTITRAEMAAIVCRAKGLENAANGAKGATKFVDVAADHWAAGYVNIASQNGIINGYGDGRFGPEDTVSFDQAVKMIVCALGFEPMAAQKGGWPTGYLVVANTYKITEGVANSTRADVATLVYNALSTPMMDQTTYGADAEFEILDGKKDRDYRTLLKDMDIYVATGIPYDVDVDEVAFYVTEDSDDLEFEYEKPGDKETPLDVAITLDANDSNIADYLFQSVDVYVEKDARNDYKVIAVVPSVVGETFAVLSDDVKASDAGSKGEVEYYVDAANSSKTKEIKFDVNTVIYNKQDVTDTKTVKELCEEADVELVFIENTGDTTYDVLVATKYTSAIVDYVDADKDKIEIDAKTVKFDFEDEEDTIILVDDAGNELELADFAENDVVAIVADAADFKDYVDYIKIVKLSNAAVTGVVESTFTSNGDSYIVIDGEEIKVDTVAVGKKLSVGDEGIFYVGMTGKVIYFDGSAAGVNYAYVLEAAISTEAFADSKWQVKLLTKDDGVVIYDMTDDASEAFATDFAGLMDDADADKDDVTAEINWASAELDVDRLVTFKTNAKGEIKSLEAVDGSLAGVDGDYNDKTQIVDKKTMEDDVIIFVINEDKADNVYATDLSYLVHEGEYVGGAYMDKDGEYAVLIVTEGDSAFSEETGFAIVTKIKDTKDAEENDVIEVSFVQDEVEGSVIFDDDSVAKGDDDVDDLDIGSVFVYNATADGVVTNYAVLAHVAKGVLTPVAKIPDVFTDDTEIFYGYISNAVRKKTSKGETIIVAELDGKLGVDDKVLATISVSSESNKYTFNDAGRNTVIEVSDFMAEDAYYAEVTKDADGEIIGVVEVTPVLVRVVDGAVIDIYTSNARQK